jgi:hypothetical protein
LVAVTVANMLEPQGRLNGETNKLLIGTVQLADAITAALAPLQLTKLVLYVTPSP